MHDDTEGMLHRNPKIYKHDTAPLHRSPPSNYSYNQSREGTNSIQCNELLTEEFHDAEPDSDSPSALIDSSPSPISHNEGHHNTSDLDYFS